MNLETIDCEQGSPQWFQARLGIPTASEFATVLAQGRKGEPSVTRRTYMLKMAGERLTGEPMETYQNGSMERGKIMEAEARDAYSFLNDAEPTRVGFVRRPDVGAGCSPDALLGDVGALEIKTAAPHILIGLMLRDEFPPEHKAQTQGVLWITGREWIDLAIYWPGLPLFVKRAGRDEAYIADLAAEVARFNAELAEIVEKVRSR